MENRYTVLITASGTGSKLGDFTKYTNKTLIRIGGKPALSHIIDRYPKNTQFVITLGHFGEQVKDFLRIAYPRHSFVFVPIDKYEGKGSSLGYSMLKAAIHLQKPFIYHASDTVVYDKIPKPSTNWIGGFKGRGSSNYTSFNILNNKIQRILDKGIIDPDYLHIGLVGIHDYKSFWKALKKLQDTGVLKEELSDFHALNDMIKNGVDFSIHEFSKWHDVGNLDALQAARNNINDPFQILDKPKESIYVIDDSVVKFFSDPKMVEQRVQRGEFLKGFVPKINIFAKNFYSYSYVYGDLMADNTNPSSFYEFLNWAFDNFWKPVKEVSNEKFKEVCHDFYFTKTLERVEDFMKSRSIQDKETVINGEKIPSLKQLLKRLDFNYLSDTAQTQFHGDFILDNILRTKKRYVFLDWRQNFGGLLKAGDMYYDLAKLNHNLVINHSIVNKNLFTLKLIDDNIVCDILRKDIFVQCQKVLFDTIEKRGLDVKKVKLLTAIAWLNMPPLHTHPYDAFLFYFGKKELWRIINEYNL